MPDELVDLDKNILLLWMVEYWEVLITGWRHTSEITWCTLWRIGQWQLALIVNWN